MSKRLVSSFPIQSTPQAMFNLAKQPLLGPNYLNFVTTITPSASISHRIDADCFDVWVNYREILKAYGLVYHTYDELAKTITLSHDGPIAQFVSVFHIGHGVVELICDYQAKVPLVSWLIAKVLDRALSQVACAMDRYAAATWGSPT